MVGAVNANAERVYADLSQYGDKWDGTDVTFSWNATWGNQLGPNLDQIGLLKGDLRSWEKLVVVVDELNNCDFFRVLVYSGSDTGHNNTFKATKTGVNEFTLSGGVDYLDQVTRICLSGSNGDDSKKDSWSETPASFKVKEVYLERPDVVYMTEEEVFEAPTGTTDINGMTGEGSIKWEIAYPKDIENETLWGGNIDGDNNSVDISAYDYLHFVVSSVSADAKCGLRVFVSTAKSDNNSTRVQLYPRPIADYADVTDWTEKYMITTPGTYVLKISDYPLLRGFKALQGWNGNAGTIKVAQAYVSTGAAPVAYTPSGKYTLVGGAALSEATATAFNVTALSGTGRTLDAANPNALFIANAGTLANTKNVIVSGVCDNLVLTDGAPFKAPIDFVATQASYTTTLDATAQAGTLCLPFEVKIPDGVEAATLNYSSGDNATATPVATTIPANTPVLLQGSGSKTFTGADAAIKADAENVAGALTGVFAATAVPANSYVLQNNASGLGFYKVTGAITAAPFRAYLTAEAAPARLGITFGDATGIETVKTAKAEEGIFNLQGQRLMKAQKGLNIINGKKILVK